MQTKNVEISPAVETKAKPKPLKTVSGKPSAVQARPVVEQPIEVTVAEKAVKAVEAKAAKEEVPRVPAAQQIWGAIKERELGLFGLAGQTVEKYCTPIELDPTRCMLKYKVSSVIPALEAVVPDFDFEVAGAYLVISKKSKK
jgi:hypothetical protein